MATFDPIYRWTMKFEDSTLAGKVVDLDDGAGLTRFGLAQNEHPDLPADYYTMSSPDALTMAEKWYTKDYWVHINGNNIADECLAAALYDYAVNSGTPTAVKALQTLVGATPDGGFGPHTLAAVNAADPTQLADSLRAERAQHDTDVANNHPRDQRFLENWLRRAACIFPDNGGL
jgi:lysozyme family protein